MKKYINWEYLRSKIINNDKNNKYSNGTTLYLDNDLDLTNCESEF